MANPHLSAGGRPAAPPHAAAPSAPSPLRRTLVALLRAAALIAAPLWAFCPTCAHGGGVAPAPEPSGGRAAATSTPL